MIGDNTKSAVSNGLLDTLRLYEQGVNDLYELFSDRYVAPCGRADTDMEESHDRLLQMNLQQRIQFHRYLIRSGELKLADFLEGNYLITFQLRDSGTISQKTSNKGLVAHVRS